MNISQFRTEYATQPLDDGRLLVQIDQTAYIVGAPSTRTGLRLSHIVGIMLTPLIAAVAPEAAAAGTEDYAPPVQDIIFGLGQGMETLSDEKFADLMEFCLGAVTLRVNKTDANPLGEVAAQPLFETHFKKNMHHLGILAAHVIISGGVPRFFGGLATVMTTQFQAQKSQSTSPATSAGLTGS